MTRKTNNNHRKLKAFSLMEVLIALGIIAIVTLLALPNLMPAITKAKSTEAMLQLEHLHTLQKTYFMINSKYSTDFGEVGFEHQKLSDEGGPANYRVEIIDASQNTFKATATAIVDFDGDGVFNVWEIDHEKNLKETVKD